MLFLVQMRKLQSSRQYGVKGRYVLFNGIMYALIVALVPLLFIAADASEYALVAFLIASFFFNIYLVYQISKLRKK
ncbi:hypothetical protein [Bacillus sp. FJAT-29937]|uniref:hypothetical protein n=1 Tax=Bacillus sp. FJAT-29937 TaxID=1720553 RepID=UPI000831E414|nr:hypothetical protein [Bacillus sp. FJAT-29937]